MRFGTPSGSLLQSPLLSLAMLGVLGVALLGGGYLLVKHFFIADPPVAGGSLRAFSAAPPPTAAPTPLPTAVSVSAPLSNIPTGIRSATPLPNSGPTSDLLLSVLISAGAGACAQVLRLQGRIRQVYRDQCVVQ